jgi:hypothetical protein
MPGTRLELVTRGFSSLSPASNPAMVIKPQIGQNSMSLPNHTGGKTQAKIAALWEGGELARTISLPPSSSDYYVPGRERIFTGI